MAQVEEAVVPSPDGENAADNYPEESTVRADTIANDCYALFSRQQDIQCGYGRLHYNYMCRCTYEEYSCDPSVQPVGALVRKARKDIYGPTLCGEKIDDWYLGECQPGGPKRSVFHEVP
jgi:hypothetical protein